MNNSGEVIRLIVAFVVIGALTWVIKRWTPSFRFGVVALVLLLVPEALRYRPGPAGWYFPLCTIAGILILAADTAGKIGRRN